MDAQRWEMIYIEEIDLVYGRAKGINFKYFLKNEAKCFYIEKF